MRFYLPALLAAGLATRAPAQEASTIRDSTLADTTFSDSTQRVTVHLFKKVVYQLQVSEPSGSPILTPVDPRVYRPTLLRITDRGGPLNGPVYEVHLDRDGEYRLGVVPQWRPVRLRLMVDSATTLLAEERANRPGWAIGFHGALGHHQSYRLSTGGVNPSGASYEAGLVVSQGSTFSLILGAGADKRGGKDFDVVWVFGELRGRLASFSTLGARRTLDWGLLFRVAQGAVETSNSDPRLYAAGVSPSSI